MTDAPQPYRHPRRGLIIPLAIVAGLLVLWTVWWFYLARQIERQVDVQVAALRADGWTVTHDRPTTRGWPFRTLVSLPRANIVAPSGHGIAAPVLRAEANAWNPMHWVVVIPDGMTLTRAEKGQVAVRGEAMRFSVNDLRARFPTLRIDLTKPTFTALPGAEPFPIASAERLQLEATAHRADPAADAIDFVFNLEDARGRAGGPVEGATQRGMLTVQLEATLDRASGLREADSAGVFSHWSAQGGRFTAVKGRLQAGESTALITSNALSAAPDGRLQGQVILTAERPLAAISGLARARSGAINRIGAAGAAAAAAASGDRTRAMVIDFRDGRTWLGPFALAPAPKLF